MKDNKQREQFADEAAEQIRHEFPAGYHYNKETIKHHIKSACKKAYAQGCVEGYARRVLREQPGAQQEDTELRIHRPMEGEVSSMASHLRHLIKQHQQGAEGEWTWVIAKLRKWGVPEQYVEAVVSMDAAIKAQQQDTERLECLNSREIREHVDYLTTVKGMPIREAIDAAMSKTRLWQEAGGEMSRDHQGVAGEWCPGPRQHGHPLVYESHCDHGETKAHAIGAAGEWTEQMVSSYFSCVVGWREACRLANAINAALRAQQQDTEMLMTQLVDWRDRAEKAEQDTERLEFAMKALSHLMGEPVTRETLAAMKREKK